ncbi:sugar transferase [Apibacter raozihei]|uniref:sugar transferase n=1 Tax=Apibacter TaxID=1778601 RepID=UPI001E347F2D|nr:MULTISPECIES: sugar transferase [Apibacter]
MEIIRFIKLWDAQNTKKDFLGNPFSFSKFTLNIIDMKIVKQITDYMLALASLFLLIIPMLIIYIITCISTQNNGLFMQKRIGKGGKEFNLYKYRTMKGHYNTFVTTSQMNITPWGKILRKYKLDELPQIFNILKGEMSWVGPRPDVPGYADLLSGKSSIILTVKPGITGPAQLKYRNEQEILSKVSDPQKYNDEILWKDKVLINIDYIENWSMANDFKYIWQTLFS